MITGAIPPVEAFLRQVQRRCRWSGFLLGCLVAGGANEAVRWAAVAFIWFTGRPFSVIDVGPLLLLTLYPVLRRRCSRAAAARRADARGGLSDRLISFVDFAGRAEIDDAVRRAQAAETARAISGLSPAAVARVSPWLATGPVLLAASIVYPFFLFSGTETTTQVVVHRIVPGGGPATDGPPAADSRPAPESGRAPRDAGGPPDPARPDEQAAGQPPPTARDDRTAPAGDQPARRPGREAASQPRRPSPPKDHALEQPASIESQRVGTSLAKLVDPVYNPGAGTRGATPPPAGTFSFRLLPKKARSGAGAAPTAAEAETPERVTVDFDALPEQYRPLVRAYFELLAGQPAASAGDNPPAGRSATP